MQSSPKSGQRNRKKHKRLDAISEAMYKQNHLQANDGAGPGPGSGESELRRSSRARRIPVVLDLSPGPPKKRRRVGKSVKEEEEGMEGGWKWRLRARRRGSLRGKRKLFEEGSEDEEGLEGGRPKRPGRVRATHGSEHDENELVEVKEEVVEDGDNLRQLDCEEDGRNDRETGEGESMKMVEVVDNLELEEECIGKEIVEAVEAADRGEATEQVDEQVEEAAGIAERGGTWIKDGRRCGLCKGGTPAVRRRLPV